MYYQAKTHLQQVLKEQRHDFYRANYALLSRLKSVQSYQVSLEEISEALTHSDTGTTQIYVNISNVVLMAVGEFALKSLKQ